MKKRILHLEASMGYGGQELRILKESIGLRKQGFEIMIGAPKGAKILEAMKNYGFKTFELAFKKLKFFSTLIQLRQIIKNEKIDLINTHSSLDAWIGGSIAKLHNIPIIRTRHLSTPIKKGLNSYLLYNVLADHVVTTCQEIVPIIINQARLSPSRCECIATGIDPEKLAINQEALAQFKNHYNLKEDDLVVGTLCILRSWKGLKEFLQACAKLKEATKIKWLIVGSGPSEERLKREAKALQIEHLVIFTGHLNPPYTALAAMDIFVLLSTANEGISQATLQAAFLKKPLITTPTGGLKEICLHEKTGLIVPIFNSDAVANAVESLKSKDMREKLGKNAHQLIMDNYTESHMVEAMIKIYKKLLKI